ncbi:MAG: hypothetical protein AAF717_20355, partial [Bacteroidota bacterium]
KILNIKIQYILLYVFLLIFLCFSAPFTYSQKVFKLNKETNQLSSEVPFDQYFYVDIEDPDGAIETFEVWSLYKIDGVLQDYKKSKRGTIYSERVIPPKGKRTDELLGVTYNEKISRLIVPPLRPNKHFELILTNKFRGQALQKFIKDVLHTFNVSNEDAGVKALINLGQSIQPKSPGIDDELRSRSVLGRYWYEEAHNLVQKDPDCAKKSDPDCAKKINSAFYIKAKAFLRTLKSPYDEVMLTTNFRQATVTSLTSISFGKAANIYKDLDKSFTLFAAFNAIEFNEDFFLGLTTPGINKKIDKHDFVLRSNYLDKSEKNLNKLLRALQRVRTHDFLNEDLYNDMITDLRTVLTEVKTNKTFIEAEIKKIVTLMDSENNMRYHTWVGGTNVATNLETISKRFIMPTIGLAYIDTEANGPNFVKPFAGASFHLRAIDKDVPLNELSSNFWHRTTIFVGFTATKLNDDTQQYSDQNSTFSLMTGLNIKLCHAIGFSFGGIILKRVDPNPTITKKQNVLSPYFGLTLDVDFAKQLSKLTSKGNL